MDLAIRRDSPLMRLILDPVNILLMILLGILFYLVLWPFLELVFHTITWVTAHGDEHAKNILIQTPAFDDGLRWFLIDLPNVSSEADWVWSIVQMRQWWRASFYIDQATYGKERQRASVRFDISQGNLLIEYELGEHIPPICHVLDRKVENLAQKISGLFEDRAWQRRYAAFMVLLFYGLVSHYRQNEHILPILFGEMARALGSELS